MNYNIALVVWTLAKVKLLGDFYMHVTHLFEYVFNV